MANRFTEDLLAVKTVKDAFGRERIPFIQVSDILYLDDSRRANSAVYWQWDAHMYGYVGQVHEDIKALYICLLAALSDEDLKEIFNI
jgi:hypothetical protein